MDNFGSLNIYGVRYISHSVSHEKAGNQGLKWLEDGGDGGFFAWVVLPCGLILLSLLVALGAGGNFEM